MIQFSTGNVGEHALHELIARPDVELVGVPANAADKMGATRGSIADRRSRGSQTSAPLRRATHPRISRKWDTSRNNVQINKVHYTMHFCREEQDSNSLSSTGRYVRLASAPRLLWVTTAVLMLVPLFRVG